MNKKGDISFLGAIPWFFLFGGIVILAFIIYGFMAEQKVYDITANAPYISEQDVLISYLRTPVENDVMLADLILQDKKEEVLLQVSALMKQTYAQADEVCWSIFLDGNIVAKRDCKKYFEKPLLDAETFVPQYYGTGKKFAKIRLTIPGNAK